uniref:ATP synthase subunit a n=1 Tax=Rhagophthalminae sp. GENSP01 TaxID=1205577 RepID=A0A0S2MNR6_9COLE|nr:ATP synthase F0 subunit 6 [Rhagophthalminae sp. GENSP01]
MMTNLFSSFDPSTKFNLSLNWTSSFMSILCIPSMFWLIPSRINFLWIKMTNLINKEFKMIIKMKMMTGSTLMFISILSLIMFNNLMSMFPYIFSSTSHLIFSLSISMPIWVSLMIYGWVNFYINMFAHLVPQGTPMFLMPFMVMIETISNIIRPWTLAIRLTANMITGHLLLNLMSNMGTSLSIMMINMLILMQMILITLEFSVSFIQSYVFTILSTLYSSEIN